MIRLFFSSSDFCISLTSLTLTMNKVSTKFPYSSTHNCPTIMKQWKDQPIRRHQSLPKVPKVSRRVIGPCQLFCALIGWNWPWAYPWLVIITALFHGDRIEINSKEKCILQARRKYCSNWPSVQIVFLEEIKPFISLWYSVK